MDQAKNLENTLNVGQIPCNSKWKIKTENEEDFVTEWEDLHHLIDIKEEKLIVETKQSGEYATQLCNQLKCDTGNTSFTNKFELRNCETNPSDTKLFEYAICDYNCPGEGNLVNHTSERPYICAICGHKFSLKASLKIHIKAHNGKKPFTCDFCDFKCLQKQYIQIHLRTHSGEKAYELCSVSFVLFRMFTNSRTIQMFQNCEDSKSSMAAETEQNWQHNMETDTFLNKFDQDDKYFSINFSKIPMNNSTDVDFQNLEIFTKDGINLIRPEETSNDGIMKFPPLQKNDVTDDVNENDCISEENLKKGLGKKIWSVKNRRERKEKRNMGKEYETVKGVVRKARKMRALISCRKKCNQKISEEIRTSIFESYWALSSCNKRRRFLLRCVTVIKKNFARVKVDGKKHKTRENTYLYEFEINGDKKVSVCKACFLATLDESPKFLQNSIASTINSPFGVGDDLRGKHPKFSLSEESLKRVRQQISSFPAYQSHYTRRRYLANHLNLSIMYKLYCNREENPISLSSYRTEFQKTGLRFKKPALDTCSTCDTLSKAKNSLDEQVKNEAEERHKKHLEEANQAYEMKNEDKIASLNTQNMRVLIFDLQQVLPTPLITSSDIIYYTRQFSVYNLTVHDCTIGKSTHHMWDESIANRGSIEIASCIYNILINMPPDVKSVVFYSDTCGGENKNLNIIAMYMYVLKLHPTLETIHHKFLITGHTNMECNSDHALIEKKSKRSPFPIYHPRDWQQLVRISSKKGNFDVKPMSQKDFFDFSHLFTTTLQKRKLDDDHDQFNFRLVRWLRFSKTDDFGVFYYKTSLDNAIFRKMSYQRKNKKDIPFDHHLPSPYETLLPISDLKKQNLLSLLDKVDSHAADFYKSLPTTSNLSDFDPDLDRLEVDGEEIEET